MVSEHQMAATAHALCGEHCWVQAVAGPVRLGADACVWGGQACVWAGVPCVRVVLHKRNSLYWQISVLLGKNIGCEFVSLFYHHLHVTAACSVLLLLMFLAGI